MTSLSQTLKTTVPSLRRYAVALTGDRTAGDRYVRVTLETLAEEPWRVRTAGDVRFQLYRLFHDVLHIFNVSGADEDEVVELTPGWQLRRELEELPLLDRELLLLVLLEGFSVKQAAILLNLQVPEAMRRLATSRARLRRIGGKTEPVVQPSAA
jgi:DNA-directed RNA polymerase specialized sigma24 family protein